MTDDEQIEIIRKCAADIWENAAKIAGNYVILYAIFAPRWNGGVDDGST